MPRQLNLGHSPESYHPPVKSALTVLIAAILLGAALAATAAGAGAEPDAKGKPKSKTGAAKPAAPAKPPPAPPKPPVPDPALAQLKPLAGTWTCTGHTLTPGPEHTPTATMTL